MHALALALLLLAAPAGAATIVIDFEDETAWGVDSFVPVEFGGVTLSSPRGLFVGDYFLGSRSLFVGEEGGSLMLTFLVPVVGVALDFGGDSGAPDVSSGLAILWANSGGAMVAIDSVTANRNMLVDQTLSVAFDQPISQAFFEFGQSDFYEPLSPVVDRIVLTTVPEPSTLVLMALALAAVGPRLRLPMRCRQQLH